MSQPGNAYAIAFVEGGYIDALLYDFSNDFVTGDYALFVYGEITLANVEISATDSRHKHPDEQFVLIRLRHFRIDGLQCAV